MAFSSYKDTASGDIDLSVQLQSYGLACNGMFYRVKAGKNTGNHSRFPAGKAADLISYRDTSAFNLSLKTTETGIRTAYSLDRHGKICLSAIGKDFYLIQIFQKGGTVVPGHFIRMFCNIVPGSCRYRNDCQTV